jgi:hypothetical protein
MYNRYYSTSFQVNTSHYIKDEKPDYCVKRKKTRVFKELKRKVYIGVVNMRKRPRQYLSLSSVWGRAGR